MSANTGKTSKKIPFSKKMGFLGDGSYGDVHTIRLNEDGTVLALKRNFVSEEVSFLGSVVEMDMLNKLKKHPNVITIKSIYTENPVKTNFPRPKMGSGFKLDKIFFGLELGKKDGFSVMVDQRISWNTRKQIIVDLMLGLEQIHGIGIIHRDIKPSNFIQTRNGGVVGGGGNGSGSGVDGGGNKNVGGEGRVNGGKNKNVTGNKIVYKWCDFGMSCYYDSGSVTDPRGVVTHSFRAPEIILGNNNYDFKSDVWSMGCLIIELLSKGHTTFLGNMEVDAKSGKQLIRIILKRLPYTPSESIVRFMDVKNIIDFNYKKTRRSNFKRILNMKKSETLSFGVQDYENVIDLLGKMIVFDPIKRLSITDLLEHPYFDSKRDYIKKTRFETPSLEPTKLKIDFWKTRKQASAFFKKHVLRKNEYWYPLRVCFHALRIYDKFVNYHQETITEPETLTAYKRLCLYLALKMFVSHRHLVPFSVYFKIKVNSSIRKLLSNMELHLISDVLSGQIYEPTLLEVSSRGGNKLTLEKKWKLYDVFGNFKKVSSIRLDDLYKSIENFT